MCIINCVCLGLVFVAGGEAQVKTATCEVTNTSGVQPIYGMITLWQQVGVSLLARVALIAQPPAVVKLSRGRSVGRSVCPYLGLSSALWKKRRFGCRLAS